MTAEEIQQRLAELRSSMREEVREIRDSSETMLDWRYYFRRFPWPMVSAAAALGFLMVPRRIEVLRPDAETLARLAKKEQLVVKQKDETKPDKGLAAVALGLVANLLMRAGTEYVSQNAGKLFGRQAAGPDGKARHGPPF